MALMKKLGPCERCNEEPLITGPIIPSRRNHCIVQGTALGKICLADKS